MSKAEICTTETEAAPTVRLTGVKSSDLRAGDVVSSHGVRVRIPQPTTHEAWTDPERTMRGRTFYFAVGTILNRGDLRDDVARYLGPTRMEWTIQGNDLTTWTVDRELSPRDLAAS
jgi:hypothetical protein